MSSLETMFAPWKMQVFLEKSSLCGTYYHECYQCVCLMRCPKIGCQFLVVLNKSIPNKFKVIVIFLVILRISFGSHSQ